MEIMLHILIKKRQKEAKKVFIHFKVTFSYPTR